MDKREVRLFLFRHGETDWNAQGRFQGHLDIPLNENGREQARALGQKLRSVGLEAIVASDLSRSFETAQLVAAQVGLDGSKIVQDAGIKEAYLGIAQGLTLEEIRARLGAEVLQRWRSNHVSDADISYPGGESGNQVMERAMSAILEFVHRYPQFSKIGISTHGGVIRRLMHQIILLSGAAPVEVIPIPNGVVYEVIYSPGSSGSDASRWQVVIE